MYRGVRWYSQMQSVVVVVCGHESMPVGGGVQSVNWLSQHGSVDRSHRTTILRRCHRVRELVGQRVCSQQAVKKVSTLHQCLLHASCNIDCSVATSGRRILVRGSMLPCRLRRRKFYHPTAHPYQEICFFPGGQLTPFAPICGRPCQQRIIDLT